MGNERFLRLPEVIRLTGLSRATIYRHIERGWFPRPVRLGPKISAWPESDIAAWQEEIIAASRLADEL